MAGARAGATAPRSTRSAFARVARRARRRSARSGGRATCGSLRDPPTTGTNKIVKRTLVHAEVPARPRRRRRAVRARARRRRATGRSRRTTRHALHDVVRALPARAVLGSVSAWTSRSPPEEHAFARRGAGVARGQPSSCRRAFETDRRRGRVGPARGRPSSRRIAGSASTGRASTAAGARRRSRSRSSTWSTRAPRAAAGQPGRHQPRRADAARARHRRAEGSAGCRRSSTPSEIWCQLFSEPDAGSDLASLHDRGRSRSTTAGCSRARRCGRRTRSSRAGASAWPAPTPTRRSTGASRTSSSTCTAPGIEVRPLVQITGEAEFNEVFLDDVFVPDDHLVGGARTTAGRWPTRRSRTSAAPRSRSRSRSCTRCTSTSSTRCAASGGALDDVEVADALGAVVRRAARAAAAQLAHALAAGAGHRARARSRAS